MNDQSTLFGDIGEWRGMPEFSQLDRRPWRHITVNFDGYEDMQKFAELLGIRLTPQSDTIWYPPIAIETFHDVQRYAAPSPHRPRFPVYVVSKGRWQPGRRRTMQVLHWLGVPHFVVVEEEEADAYRANLEPSSTVIVLPPWYRDDYNPCDDLGQSKGLGPGPARNFAWDHAAGNGFAWHWVMDDNINSFVRLNRNKRVPVADGTMFYAMEEFVSRYENVAMAGPNYLGFAKSRDPLPPYTLNTRIYSCNLIRNELPYRWRGRYNEDTDLSLRMLKDGLVTVQFNAFLQEKVMTQRTPGGNTAEFYDDEGTMPKSEMLVALHPDRAKRIWKFDRWHHQVDYAGFPQRLRLRAGLRVDADNDEFGMEYQVRADPSDDWETVRP